MRITNLPDGVTQRRLTYWLTFTNRIETFSMHPYSMWYVIVLPKNSQHQSSIWLLQSSQNDTKRKKSKAQISSTVGCVIARSGLFSANSRYERRLSQHSLHKSATFPRPKKAAPRPHRRIRCGAALLAHVLQLFPGSTGACVASKLQHGLREARTREDLSYHWEEVWW